MAATIRVGPAGWSYDDWRGIVYPPGAGAKFDQLAYIAGFFDTIEINSSFYLTALRYTRLQSALLLLLGRRCEVDYINLRLAVAVRAEHDFVVGDKDR